VCQTLHVILHIGGVDAQLDDPLMLLAAYLAAIVHGERMRSPGIVAMLHGLRGNNPFFKVSKGCNCTPFSS